MSAPASTVKQNATLLIVYEEQSARDRLRKIFEDAGYRALTVSDAPSALRLIHREPCDLIVLDLEIPGVDALALCRLLRAQPATKTLPVIALSDSNIESRKSDAFAAGADDFIIKPSNPDELVSRVNTQLRSAQREWDLIGSNRELRFLADLGRGLLRAIEPEQLVRRVAGS
ncbi:MAG TPA: response regulator transcription factor, partial [Pyrinomonadaceae bacterium]|nr:response regulator transcription factor [Pyrinomonadaceae bacterium]